jgi:hypothetical protein
VKGPGLRLDLEVRREWQCPVCGRRDRFEGAVVSALCPCRDAGVPMKLVEPRRQVRKFEVPVRMAIPEPVALQPDQVAPQPVDSQRPPMALLPEAMAPDTIESSPARSSELPGPQETGLDPGQTERRPGS